jgi:hypothetical protein
MTADVRRAIVDHRGHRSGRKSCAWCRSIAIISTADPRADRPPIRSRPSDVTPVAADQKAHRVTPDSPYNPHKVCDAEPRGFVQQGLSARHARGAPLTIVAVRINPYSLASPR